MIGVTVLGSTGSIGVSTLDVLSRHPDRFRVVALTANRDLEGLFRQCLTHRPDYAVMSDPSVAAELERRLAQEVPGIEVLAGAQALEQVAALTEVDYVMAAIVGAAGLLPALAAVRAGKRLLLANKEALVVSGRLFMETAGRHGARILPIDSEHNAVFQCMPPALGEGQDQAGVRRILLTASGGPFRTWAAERLASATPEQACAHPNWDMGRKISVDSATMMNKGLEVIEACWLFDTTPERVDVLIHPQSIIHSMVEYLDGSVLAQMGNPDMRTPIAHALCWPERMASGVETLDLVAAGPLAFEPADLERFPCLRLGYEAVRIGGTATAILNAANEVAVGAFLDGCGRFTDIPKVIESTLSAQTPHAIDSLETVLRDDAAAREVAGEHVARLAQSV
jgi:1-deoxy-D-xylulose-5-phosphate reductoisomerase